MAGQGVGASVLRKEDERFLRGHGQYVADFRLPGAREVAFVRSSVAHGRIRNVHVPDEHKGAVFTAHDLANVNPIRAATALSGFKHSSEPILARDKVRYVGELVAICVAPSRAQAEDIADSVTVEYEELEPVVDMLAARRAHASLVHEEWGDNVFIEFIQDGAIDRIAETAAIKVTREIRTARHCMFPLEGRGVLAHWDARLGFLTRITGYADGDGRLLALDCVATVDAGAYSVYPTSSALEAAQVASLLPGPYDFSAYRCRSAAVATNKCSILPYRGVARSGVCLAVEVIMDAIARQAGLEPYEVRLKNLVRPEQMPFENVTKKQFDG